MCSWLAGNMSRKNKLGDKKKEKKGDGGNQSVHQSVRTRSRRDADTPPERR